MTDQELMETLQYALMEPPDAGATWPSGLWTREEVLARMNERQNRFLKSSQVMVGMAEIPILAGVATVALPEDWLITQDVVWTGAVTGTIRPLMRSDQFQADHAETSWPITQGLPAVYFDYDQPMLQIRVSPAPTEAGTLLLLYIPQGAAFDGTGELPSLADEFVDAACKYGPLADLLAKDGRGASLDRAGYAESRFQLGLAAAQVILRSSWVG